MERTLDQAKNECKTLRWPFGDTMNSNPKVGRWKLEPNPLLEAAELVFSELSASQPSEEGFYLTGGLFFNEGSLEFENGRCSFYVKDVTLTAECVGAHFEPQTVGFRQTQRDSRSIEVTSTTEVGRGQTKAGEVSGEIGFKLPTGIAAGLGAGARAEIRVTEQSSQQGVEQHTMRQPLVWAQIRSRSEVSWRIQADPASVVMGANVGPVLSGGKLMDGGEAILGYVKRSENSGRCELSVGVKHVHIVFTDIQIDEAKPLRDLSGEVLRGRDKKAIISRLCLQKALEGSIRLGSLP